MNVGKRLIGVALFAAIAVMAFAADAPKATKFSITLVKAETIAGTQLQPGDYKVQVVRDGDMASVRILDGKREVVSTTGKYRPLSKFYGITAFTIDGNNQIVEVQSMKLKGAVDFTTTAAVASGQGSK